MKRGISTDALSQMATQAGPLAGVAIGRIFAERYQILELLGRGGMGAVYLADDREVGENVALKVLEAHAEGDDSAVERFRREVRLARRVTHPNAARTYDLGLCEGIRYLSMEYVTGRNLQDILQETRFDSKQVASIALQLCAGLKAAHDAGVIHRDLKPENILIENGTGRVVITDFGIARALDSDGDAMRTAGAIGTPAYMSPEQLECKEVDQRTDIYALGVLMFELLVGKPPFAGERTLETLMAHLNDPIPSVREKSPFDLPPVLDELITACLAKKPEDRPETVAALKDALRSVLVEIAETSTTASRLSTESLIRKALDKRDRRDDPLDPPTALSHPTLNRPHVAPGRSRLWIAVPLLLAGLAILTLGVGTILAVTFGARPVDDPVQTTLAEEPPTEAAPAEVPLQLTSTPDGAEVWEGTRMHGVTPLDLTLRSDGGERQFQLKLPGFEPHALLQGPSDAPVALHTELTPVLPEPVAAPRPPPEPKPRPRPKPSSDLDILIER